MFKKVTRTQARLRLALEGPSGSGKTYSALRFAFLLAGPGGRVCVIDSEHGSAAKYAGYAPDGIPWEWDGCDLQHHAMDTYVTTIEEAGRQGYDVVVVDSLSHAWVGKGGALEAVDEANSRNRFTAWKDVTPEHNKLIDTIIRSPCHVIATMRTKTEYVLEEDDKGKKVPRKVGTKAVQREGMDYEFDLVGTFDRLHCMEVTKTRCPAVDGKKFTLPGPEFVTAVRQWLEQGVAPPATRPAPVAAPSPNGDAVEQSVETRRGGGIHMVAPTNGHAELTVVEDLGTQIKTLAMRLGHSPTELRARIAALGATSLATLSAEQAQALLGDLQAEELKREGAALG